MPCTVVQEGNLFFFFFFFPPFSDFRFEKIITFEVEIASSEDFGECHSEERVWKKFRPPPLVMMPME